ncbi:PREDICTED: AAA-ATPase At2g46620-like [Nicotiana attenuata]|uniref:Aaa-atpase n=1 Tax=Nicotiana attenuata TaxID=49451 RepID=A0A1J6KNR1_NICAT|nr:PREDICTED: AAA-ATPase At2g46620-like [Nicotiana attenuata]OIT26504.1 aaa-atpase [Nicotiana attenuata]
MFLYVIAIIASSFLLKFVLKTSLVQILKKWWRLFEDGCYVYQFYRVPQFNHNMQENQLYRKVCTYLNSLPCVEDSDFTNLFSGDKSNEINLVLDSNQIVVDNFLSARVCWINEQDENTGLKSLVMKIRKNDKRRILQPYLQHIHSVFDEIEQRKKEVRLFLNVDNEPQRNGRWRSVPFTHPATFETIVMDADLKNKVKSDLENFQKSKQYYHRLGKVWKRSYLLYGPSGTGKSTFIAGVANMLNYDVYDVDLSKVTDDSDLKMLLLQTTNKSLIVIEDLDSYLGNKSTAVSLSGILNFMDGIFSCCGEERIMIFTVNNKDQIDPTVLRPGRIDVHIHFPLCDFNAFKSLANSHLGLKDHKLFPQVEEIFQTGAVLSPAEIGEIMISNRSSPTRALKSVISALHINTESRAANRHARRLSESGSVRTVEETGDSGIFCKDGVRDFKKLYGLLRIRSGRKDPSFEFDTSDKDNSRHDN